MQNTPPLTQKQTKPERLDCAVIGAGVVGLAIARALAMSGRDVVVLEAADTIGTGISSRNSEVIHAGIYYAAGSLKAELCVSGRDRLYDYCKSHGVGYSRTGKLIVATEPDQLEEMNLILKTARRNGVEDLVKLDKKEVLALEPQLRAEGALLSPSTGIVDSHGLMLSYQGDAEDAGAVIAFRSPVTGGRIDGERIIIETGNGDGNKMSLSCKTVVNCAGLFAQEVAASIAGIAPETIPPRFLSRGCYFTLSGKSPFSRLIYPMPDRVGLALGIHVTLDLAGQTRFGPDVQWVDEIDYSVDAARGEAFYQAIRTYWPNLKNGQLVPGYAGIRPKMQGPGGEPLDFVFQGAKTHGIEGLVNLYGIESPGLTSSLSIADKVLDMLS